MKSLWENPPRTVVEVYCKLPEGTRCEVINNVLHMLPRNPVYHQRVLMDILCSIGEYTSKRNLGDFIPGTDVYLDALNAVQPDLLFVAADNMKIIGDDDYIHGSPDMIVEILLPESKNHDEMKKKIFEKLGVKEYWMIDPVTKQANGFSLRGRKYNSLPITKAKIKSPLLKKTFSF